MNDQVKSRAHVYKAEKMSINVYKKKMFLFRVCLLVMALTRITKECLWRLVMRSAGILADRFDDVEKTADPRQVLLDLLAEKGQEGDDFAPYFIAYMEGMRHYLPPQDYRELREWVFNTMSHVIPSYKTLFSMLLGKLACCLLDAVWRYGQTATTFGT